ncbi:NAD-dependent epimerase/dehydratase family protein [Microbulbifer sediminum]|uniref:NAD-dependent epimerase/dehydratase family protein n=1 Tax=Microbulbifer sediminum TaxID=2904250 RepID=UPI001F00404F|nr:NAD-dependent epimerase/dehydratase family protein [Microbulbifer sediminum]
MYPLNSALVTGAGGFIGRYLVQQLIADGIEVVALRQPGELLPPEWRRHVRIVTGDIRTLTALEARIGPVDAVFHLAALVSDWGPRKTHFDITVGGTAQAIELALRWNARFILASSICVWGDALSRGRLDENSPLGRPTAPYEFCKQQQERLTRQAVVHGGLRATIVRPGNVYGLGSPLWVETLAGLLRKRRPCLLGSGDWDAGLVHVRNLVAIMLASARSNYSRGDIFLAADGLGITWREYLDHLAHILNAPAPVSIPRAAAVAAAPLLEFAARLLGRQERPLFTRQACRLVGGPNEFYPEKAERLLGYTPVITFEEAMDELRPHLS